MIIPFHSLSDLRAQYADKKIVLASGVFDVFHINHLRYLEDAQTYGDICVVMVSNDVRTRLSKGENRPIFPENDRAAIIDGLKGIDFVFIEPGEQKRGQVDEVYKEVFATLRPDVYVTANEGWDKYREVVGDAELVILSRVAGGRYSSTSAIIDHISNL